MRSVRARMIGALDHVLELADVAGPARRRRGARARRRRSPRTALPSVSRVAAEEVVDEQRDVLAALAERRDRDPHDVEAVEEVLAEAAGGDLGRRGRGWSRRSRARRPGAASLADAAGPPPPGARGGASPAARAAARRSRRGRACRRRPRAKRPRRARSAPVKAPRGVAEELALEQGLGDRRAVDRDEGLVAPRRLRVDGARDHLLAGAALAEQQHRGLELRRALDDLEHLRSCPARPPRSAARRTARSTSRWSSAVAAPQPLALPGLAEREQHLGRLEGLCEVVVRAAPHRLDRELGRAVGRHQDHGGVRQAAQRAPAAARARPCPGMRRSQSTTSAGWASRAARAAAPSRAEADVVALRREHELEALAQRVVVVRDQDPLGHRRSRAALSDVRDGG